MKLIKFNTALSLLLSFFSAATFAQNNGTFILGAGTITGDTNGVNITVNSGVANGETVVAIEHFDSINIANGQTLSVQNGTGGNLRNIISADGTVYIAGNVQTSGSPVSLSMIAAGGVTVTNTANIYSDGTFIAASGTVTNDGVSPDVVINLNSAGVSIDPSSNINAGSTSIGTSNISYLATEDDAYLPFVSGNTNADIYSDVTIDAANHSMQSNGVISDYGSETINNATTVTLNNLRLMDSSIPSLAAEKLATDSGTTIILNNAQQYGSYSQLVGGNFILNGSNEAHLKLQTLNADSLVNFNNLTNNSDITITGENEYVTLTGNLTGSGSLRADAGGVNVNNANIDQSSTNFNGLNYGVNISNSTLSGYKLIEGKLTSNNSTYNGGSYFDYGDVSFTDDTINGYGFDTSNNTANVNLTRTNLNVTESTIKSTGNVNLSDGKIQTTSMQVSADGDVVINNETGNTGITWIKGNNVSVNGANLITDSIGFTTTDGVVHPNYEAVNNLDITNSTLSASTNGDAGGKVLVLGTTDDSAGTNTVDSETYYFSGGGSNTTKTGTATTNTNLSGLTLSAANIALDGATLQNKAKTVVVAPTAPVVTTPVTTPVVTDPVVTPTAPVVTTPVTTDPVTTPVTTDPVVTPTTPVVVVPTIPVCAIGSNACGEIPVITTPAVPTQTTTSPELPSVPVTPAIKLPNQPIVNAVQIGINDKAQSESRGNYLLIGSNVNSDSTVTVNLNDK